MVWLLSSEGFRHFTLRMNECESYGGKYKPWTSRAERPRKGRERHRLSDRINWRDQAWKWLTLISVRLGMIEATIPRLDQVLNTSGRGEK